MPTRTRTPDEAGIAVGLLGGDGDRREHRRRHAGPQRHVVALVERPDRHQHAVGVAQPGLVELAVVASGQAGGVELDAPAGVGALEVGGAGGARDRVGLERHVGARRSSALGDDDPGRGERDHGRGSAERHTGAPSPSGRQRRDGGRRHPVRGCRSHRRSGRAGLGRRLSGDRGDDAVLETGRRLDPQGLVGEQGPQVVEVGSRHLVDVRPILTSEVGNAIVVLGHLDTILAPTYVPGTIPVRERRASRALIPSPPGGVRAGQPGAGGRGTTAT